MDFTDFIAGIRFRLIHPAAPRPVVTLPYPTCNYYRQNLLMEMENVELPTDEQLLRNDMLSIWDVPRLSTFANGVIINRAVSGMPVGQAFVHAGTFNSYALNAFHFLAGIVNNPNQVCIGVDHFTRFGNRPEPFHQHFNAIKSDYHCFYDMDFAEYFTHHHRTPIGCYMFDGAHDYNSQLGGLKLAEPYLAAGCIIVAADVNWAETRQAMLDFVQYSAGSFRILLDMQTNGNCHPTFWNGLMVLQKVQ